MKCIVLKPSYIQGFLCNFKIEKDISISFGKKWSWPPCTKIHSNHLGSRSDHWRSFDLRQNHPGFVEKRSRICQEEDHQLWPKTRKKSKESDHTQRSDLFFCHGDGHVNHHGCILNYLSRNESVTNAHFMDSWWQPHICSASLIFTWIEKVFERFDFKLSTICK